MFTSHVCQVDSDRDIPVNVIVGTDNLNGIDEISRFGGGKGRKLFAEIVIQNTTDELVLRNREIWTWIYRKKMKIRFIV